MFTLNHHSYLSFIPKLLTESWKHIQDFVVFPLLRLRSLNLFQHDISMKVHEDMVARVDVEDHE